jgi:hypothetical protein
MGCKKQWNEKESEICLAEVNILPGKYIYDLALMSIGTKSSI